METSVRLPFEECPSVFDKIIRRRLFALKLRDALFQAIIFTLELLSLLFERLCLLLDECDAFAQYGIRGNFTK